MNAIYSRQCGALAHSPPLHGWRIAAGREIWEMKWNGDRARGSSRSSVFDDSRGSGHVLRVVVCPCVHVGEMGKMLSCYWWNRDIASMKHNRQANYRIFPPSHYNIIGNFSWCEVNKNNMSLLSQKKRKKENMRTGRTEEAESAPELISGSSRVVINCSIITLERGGNVYFNSNNRCFKKQCWSLMVWET